MCSEICLNLISDSRSTGDLQKRKRRKITKRETVEMRVMSCERHQGKDARDGTD